MIDDFHSDDLQLDKAIRDAFPNEIVAPRELAGRIRMTVHAEAAREPVRRRRALGLRMGLSFACACMAGYVMSARVREWQRGASRGKHAYIAGIAPSAVTPGLVKALGPGRQLQTTVPEEFTRSGRPSIMLAGEVTEAGPTSHRRVMQRAAASNWTHERLPVVAPVADTSDDESPTPSTIRISVTDPFTLQIRSLRLDREVRNGDVSADLHYTTRPILTSAGN